MKAQQTAQGTPCGPASTNTTHTTADYYKQAVMAQLATDTRPGNMAAGCWELRRENVQMK